MPTTTLELRDRMSRALDQMKALAASVPAGADLTAEQVEAVDRHQREYDDAKRLFEASKASDEIKANLAAIGLRIPDGTDPAEKSAIVERAEGANYKTRAAAPWALGAATRIRESLDVAGTKALIAPVAVPDPVAGPVPLAAERNSLLPLVPTRAMSGRNLEDGSAAGNVFGYVRQTTRTNNADAVPDSALKPTSVYEWTDVVDRARVIAHLSEAFPKRILDDHQALIRVLQQDLATGILDAIEDQIVNGTGTIAAAADGTPTVAEEQLPGVLGTSGVRTQAWDTDLLATLAAAWDALEVVNEQPNAWIMNTSDYRRLKSMRESGTTGPLMFKSGRSSIEQILGEVPVITTPVIPAGTALLGDWRQTLLVVREETTIARNEGDDSLFNYNLVRFRAETRVGFAVLRPGAFVVVDVEEPEE
ncbi:MAG TPA: phage major capsid protein [Microbacterium sp.]|nr:phage major capsid protein [Microbacterium sp.]